MVFPKSPVLAVFSALAPDSLHFRGSETAGGAMGGFGSSLKIDPAGGRAEVSVKDLSGGRRLDGAGLPGALTGGILSDYLRLEVDGTR